jgi:hypothetical protein
VAQATARLLAVALSGAGSASLDLAGAHFVDALATGGGVLTLDARVTGAPLPPEIIATIASRQYGGAITQQTEGGATVLFGEISATIARTHISGEIDR